MNALIGSGLTAGAEISGVADAGVAAGDTIVGVIAVVPSGVETMEDGVAVGVGVTKSCITGTGSPRIERITCWDERCWSRNAVKDLPCRSSSIGSRKATLPWAVQTSATTSREWSEGGTVLIEVWCC